MFFNYSSTLFYTRKKSCLVMGVTFPCKLKLNVITLNSKFTLFLIQIRISTRF